MKARRILAPHAKIKVSASVLALVSSLPAAHAQTTDTWSLGSSGNWNTAGDWSTGVVPNNGVPSGSSYNVDITDGKSTVTLNINATINDLTMGAGNTLVIPTGATFQVVGPTIANAGSIQVNGGAGNNAVLYLDGNTTLSGTGTLTLGTASGGGTAYLEQASGGLTLTNQSTIQGSGIIGNGGLTVANSGTIDANTATGGGIVLNGAGGITNTKLLEATGGGTLSIETNVVNTGANITASGTGSIVDLEGVTITGGTLTAKTGGALQSVGTTTLAGVTLASGTIYPIATATETVVSGSFTDNGTVQINGGAGNNAILGLATSVTPGGPITMSVASGGGEAYIEQQRWAANADQHEHHHGLRHHRQRRPGAHQLRHHQCEHAGRRRHFPEWFGRCCQYRPARGDRRRRAVPADQRGEYRGRRQHHRERRGQRREHRWRQHHRRYAHRQRRRRADQQRHEHALGSHAGQRHDLSGRDRHHDGAGRADHQ